MNESLAQSPESPVGARKNSALALGSWSGLAGSVWTVVLVSLFLLGGGSWAYYGSQKAECLEGGRQQLAGVAVAKASLLAEWYQARQAVARSLFSSPGLRFQARPPLRLAYAASV
jgi:hypothetical protein